MAGMYYYVLVGIECSTGEYTMLFGDYDRETVEFERNSMKSDTDYKSLSTHRLTWDTEAAIADLLAELNSSN